MVNLTPAPSSPHSANSSVKDEGVQTDLERDQGMQTDFDDSMPAEMETREKKRKKKRRKKREKHEDSQELAGFEDPLPPEPQGS